MRERPHPPVAGASLPSPPTRPEVGKQHKAIYIVGGQMERQDDRGLVCLAGPRICNHKLSQIHSVAMNRNAQDHAHWLQNVNETVCARVCEHTHMHAHSHMPAHTL